MKKEFIEVYQAKGEVQAQLIKGLLESYGIPSLIKSNAAPSVLQFTVDKLGEFKVMVREEDAEEARNIIENKNDANS